MSTSTNSVDSDSSGPTLFENYNLVTLDMRTMDYPMFIVSNQQ